jgi:serine carboxypeptidase-like clade 2
LESLVFFFFGKKMRICFILILIVYGMAAPQADLVNLSALPGMPPYDTPIYSGYLNISDDKQMHYVFLQSQTDTFPSDPIILWLNGGPGCSSLIGWLNENGPFVFPDGSIQLEANNQSWNLFANVLYLESPAGVGFSYANLPDNYTYNDTIVAEDNLAAVVLWFKLFPEYANNKFWIAGESYAGVYVPYLAVYIHNYNINNSTDPDFNAINLQGTMVGNACTNYNYDCDPADKDMYWYYSLYSPQTRNQMEQWCESDPSSTECSAAYADMLLQVQNINQLDILRNCFFDEIPYLAGQQNYTRRYTYPIFYQKYLELFHPELKTMLGNLDCTDSLGIQIWLNNDTVREALHVMNTTMIPQWEQCNNTMGNNYVVSWDNASYWAYPILIQNGYNLLVYSGDTDGCVPTVGSIRWITALREEMNLVTIKPWAPWTYQAYLLNGWNS